MWEIEVPTSHISSEARASFIVSEDIPYERMLKGDVAFIRQCGHGFDDIKNGHLYAVVSGLDNDLNDEVETKLFRILKVGDNMLALYLPMSKEMIIKSFDEIYIAGEVFAFQSSVTAPQEVA